MKNIFTIATTFFILTSVLAQSARKMENTPTNSENQIRTETSNLSNVDMVSHKKHYRKTYRKRSNLQHKRSCIYYMD